MRLTNIRADVNDWNVASISLFASLGFHRLDPGPVGLPGWIYFGLTSDGRGN